MYRAKFMCFLAINWLVKLHCKGRIIRDKFYKLDSIEEKRRQKEIDGEKCIRPLMIG